MHVLASGKSRCQAVLIYSSHLLQSSTHTRRFKSRAIDVFSKVKTWHVQNVR